MASVTFLIFFCCLFAACSNSMKDIQTLTGDRTEMQNDKAEKIYAIFSKDGKFKMRIYADEFIHNMAAKPSYIDLNRNLRIDFYNDSTSEIDNVLTADSCRYYEAQGNILIWGRVLIVRKRTGEKLSTTELVWNESVHKFFTEKPVDITTETEVIHGTGMEANQDFSWYRITAPSGTVQVKKEEVPE